MRFRLQSSNPFFFVSKHLYRLSNKNDSPYVYLENAVGLRQIQDPNMLKFSFLTTNVVENLT